MSNTTKHDVTQLLRDWQAGDTAAREALLPLVYEELRRLARHYLRGERLNHTLQPTALVHEAYLKMVGMEQIAWQNRAQFFGMAATLMRQILVDHARAYRAEKRGSGEVRLALDDAINLFSQPDFELIALDDALHALAKLDAQQARVVELRFFAGLTIEETAEVLGLSPMTIKREWRTARLWLRHEISRQKPADGNASNRELG
jgi:RNA polymerase sigma factor (TIGR02999 family)